MKFYSNNNCSRIAVGLLFLIQITATMCTIKRSSRTITISNLRFLPNNLFENETSSITTLYINNNNFSTLPDNIFSSQLNLKTVDLRLNGLETLSENTFSSQVNLLVLDLRANNLTELHEKIFKNQANLLLLDIGMNRLETLPENIFKNQIKLKLLNLHKNKLKALPEIIFKSQINLQTLILWENNLTALPENLFQNQVNLRTLLLWENGLTTLPEHMFKNQANLEWLDLSRNNLSTLPEKIFKGKIKLEHLNLEENELKTLSKNILSNIAKNSNLNIFALNKNPWLCDCDFLKIIQSHMSKFRFDEIICADDQKLRDKLKHPIISMKTERSVDPTVYSQKYVNSTICSVLPTNETKICPKECNCLFPMNETSMFVDCSNNNLEDVPSGLTNLSQRMPALNEIELNFDNNNIATLPNSTMNGFQMITKISARNNLIKYIDVNNLPQNLKEFDLSKNKLESLTISVIERLSNMRMLKKLTLDGNPWTCDESFIDFIQLIKEDVNYQEIVCNDGENFGQKRNRLLGSRRNQL